VKPRLRLRRASRGLYHSTGHPLPDCLPTFSAGLPSSPGQCAASLQGQTRKGGQAGGSNVSAVQVPCSDRTISACFSWTFHRPHGGLPRRLDFVRRYSVSARRNEGQVNEHSPNTAGPSGRCRLIVSRSCGLRVSCRVSTSRGSNSPRRLSRICQVYASGMSAYLPAVGLRSLTGLSLLKIISVQGTNRIEAVKLLVLHRHVFVPFWAR